MQDEQATERDEKRVYNVAIVLWDGVELLDFAGPGEVFAAARTEQGPCFNVFTVSHTTDPIKSQGFVTVVPEYSLKDCPSIDIVVLPGGGTNSVTSNREFLQQLETKIGDADIALSVCTGAFILGYLGHLDGLEVTTWHGAIGRLKAQHHEAKVLKDRRFIDTGKIVTSAGVSAGIDSSLHLVARLFGTPTAVETARYMEYEWQYADQDSDAPKSKGKEESADER